MHRILRSKDKADKHNNMSTEPGYNLGWKESLVILLRVILVQNGKYLHFIYLLNRDDIVNLLYQNTL